MSVTRFNTQNNNTSTQQVLIRENPIIRLTSGEPTISPKYTVKGVTVDVKIDHIIGEKLNPKPPEQEIEFNVKAKLEEQERKSNQITIIFALVVGTKPSVVKYAVRGTATLEGRMEDLEKMLEIDPETRVPHILNTVYQHVFTSVYLLSTILNAPYPPPDLLHTQEEKMGLPPEEEAVITPTEAAESSPPTPQTPTEETA